MVLRTQDYMSGPEEKKEKDFDAMMLLEFSNESFSFNELPDDLIISLS